MLKLLKKITFYLIIILVIMYGYHFMTGKSITTLPREIVDKLQQKDTRTESTNPRYYTDPAKDIPKD